MEIPNSMEAPPEEGQPAGGVLEEYRRGNRSVLWLTVREGRRFILKGLPASLRHHPEEIARLRKEYSLGLRINHPGVAGVYGFEIHPEVGPVIVMEYVDGMTLWEFLWKGNHVPLNVRVGIARQVADALAYIHSLGLSHRDLKPDNILVTRRNEVKIIDIGLGDSEDSVVYKQSVGTEAFGAPEQQSPSIGDSRSDVYSFGKILQLLLPERKFSRLRSACLQEDPDRRTSMQEAIQMLEAAETSRGGRFLKWGLICAGILIVLFIAMGLWEGGSKVTPSQHHTVSSGLITIHPDTLSVESEKTEGNEPFDILIRHAHMVDSMSALYDVYFDRDTRSWKDSKEERSLKTQEIGESLKEELEVAGCEPLMVDLYLKQYWEYVVDVNKRMDELMDELKQVQEKAK